MTSPPEFIPLSVRYGNRRKRLGWKVKGWRQDAALRLAPWLGGAVPLAPERYERETTRLFTVEDVKIITSMLSCDGAPPVEQVIRDLDAQTKLTARVLTRMVPVEGPR